VNGLLAASVALAALAAAALAGALSRPPAVAGRLTALTPARPAVADRLFIGVGRLAMWRRPTQTSAAGDLRSTGRRAVLAAVAALVAVAATDLATGLFLAPLAAAAAWQLDLRSGRARRRRSPATSSGW
jgi:hypothetical protein